MHLAALVGTPCVAVFSARAKPGVWFPRGSHNRIFYPWHEAERVPARPGFRIAGASISSIEPDGVAQACLELLASPVAA
jgi:heptosyltransferase III